MERLEFLRFLLPESHGLVRLVAGRFSQKERRDGDWKETFLQWNGPSFDKDLEKWVAAYKGVYDIGFSPVLFEQPGNSKKENVLAVACVWADLDKGIPEDYGILGEPSILVNTSPGKFHAYWKTETFTDWEVAERTNKYIARHIKDDHGWQINKILRLPGTLSHKNGKAPVEIVRSEFRTIALPSITEKKEPLRINIKGVDKQQIPTLPEVVTILFQYKKLPKRVVELVTGEPIEEGKRSDQLWYLANTLHEFGVRPKDLTSLMLFTAKKCGKFFEHGEGRPEALIQLVNTVLTSGKGGSSPSGLATTPAPKSLLDITEAEPEKIPWILEPLIHEGSFWLIGGVSNIGKSQFMLNIGIELVTGGSFLGWEVTAAKQQKVLVVQAEMSDTITANIFRKMVGGRSPQELEKIRSGMDQWTTQGAVFLNDESNQDYVRGLIQDGGYTGVVFDSLSAFAPGMVEDKDIRPVIEFLDSIRYGDGTPWVGVIGHPRKMPAGIKAQAEELNDVIGSIVIQQRIDSAFMLVPRRPSGTDDESGLIVVRHIKARLTEKGPDLLIRRTEKLGYEVVEDHEEPSSEVKVVKKKRDDGGGGFGGNRKFTGL